MGYRIFLKGKAPVVVDTLAEAKKITDIPSVKKEEGGTEVSYESLPNIGDKYAGHLNAPVPIKDPTISPEQEYAAANPTVVPPVEVTVSEEDFAKTCPDVNLIRVTGSDVAPDKSLFKATNK
jgi:hypothetical protein